MSAAAVNLIGLSLGVIGSIMLIIYSNRTEGAPDRGTKNHLFPRWVYVVGSWLLPIGILLQLIVASCDVLSQ